MDQKPTGARGDGLREVVVKYELLNAETRGRLRAIASRMQAALRRVDDDGDEPGLSRRAERN